eukprot:CAMPEP_0113721614 /NCGR_PEP_ID=MMETSP0038_2-20120614/37246_1 /TAXON_ID=2898 /ORGANISM="Cryptomonas paramecium" /LENGTH=53 /DNA_ID=CAMNT_0000650673 /DNA_START=583 /DNA_END=741 /DNA_ORIENTATION=- /assembly_acc=CAM_ASM_000170
MFFKVLGSVQLDANNAEGNIEIARRNLFFRLGEAAALSAPPHHRKKARARAAR